MTSVSLGYKDVSNRWQFGLSLGGAFNAKSEDSPLFEDKTTYMMGAGVVRRLHTSKRKASF